MIRRCSSVTSIVIVRRLTGKSRERISVRVSALVGFYSALSAKALALLCGCSSLRALTAEENPRTSQRTAKNLVLTNGNRPQHKTRLRPATA